MTAADTPFDAGHVTLGEVATQQQIADRLGRACGTVRNWRWDPPDGFPEPVAVVGQSPVWVWGDVEWWARHVRGIHVEGLDEALEPGVARQARQALGLSMAEVAETLGVGENSVSRWERGIATPSGENAEAWADWVRDARRKLEDDDE